MENQPDESKAQDDESFLKPKQRVKRNISDEQRLILAERMGQSMISVSRMQWQRNRRKHLKP